ncbi:hypothetical protein GMMP13_380161 [Candidatus Magnetomoraceae bacterium gMMP-13]
MLPDVNMNKWCFKDLLKCARHMDLDIYYINIIILFSLILSSGPLF